MSSIIDPITGLPYDALDTTLYSIPLDSQPYLAPEFNPQGRINSSVYPDNGPSVLATLQALNELNPKTVQAGTMDGNGNLNVNVKAQTGGGGGATPIVPTANIIGGALLLNASAGQNFGPLRLDRSKKVWMFSGALTLFADAGASDISDTGAVGLINTNDGNFLPLLMFGIWLSKTTAAFYSFPGGQQTVVFPNGLDLSTYYPAGADIALAAGWTDLHIQVGAIAIQ